jgi:phosphoribosyl-AMP cyclohydrolase
MAKMPASPAFAARGDTQSIETGAAFAPKFDTDGLILAVVADAATAETLMVAYMDREALSRTIATGQAWFWSRSRRQLWRKGETSGNTLAVTEIRVDCDQDALLLKVDVAGDGAACHRGYRSCFYRTVEAGEGSGDTATLAFDPKMPRVPSPR